MYGKSNIPVHSHAIGHNNPVPRVAPSSNNTTQKRCTLVRQRLSSGIIEDINLKFYYKELYSNVEKENNKADIEIKNILNNLFADIEYSNTQEKLKLYLNTYNRLYDDIVISNSNKLKKIRIALDQIDLLDSVKMLEIMHNNFI